MATINIIPVPVGAEPFMITTIRTYVLDEPESAVDRHGKAVRVTRVEVTKTVTSSAVVHDAAFLGQRVRRNGEPFGPGEDYLAIDVLPESISDWLGAE